MLATIIKQPRETSRQVVAFATGAAIVEVVDVSVTPRGLVAGAPALAAEAMIA